jgi:hypothetical protein
MRTKHRLYVSADEYTTMDLLAFSKIVRMAVGGVIVLFAYRAYERTGYSPMILVALGFGLIGIASTAVEEILRGLEHARLLSELTEILGLIVLVVAIRRS